MDNDIYIAKAMAARVPAESIAAKLGMSAEQVKARFNALVKEAEKANVNGYVSLMEAFNILANQYQLLGMSLAAIHKALGDTASVAEIADALPGHPDALNAAGALAQKFIVLRQFVPPSVCAEEVELKGTVGGG